MTGLFLRDFDAEIASAQESVASSGNGDDADIQTASFSVEEVEKLLLEARESAFSEGRDVGITEAREEEQASREEQVMHVLTSIGDQLGILASQDIQRRAEIQARLADSVLEIGERILPTILTECALEQISAQVLAGLDMAIGSAKVVAYLSPDMLQSVVSLISDTDGSGRPQILFQPDPELRNEAVRIEWDNGFLDFDPGHAGEVVLDLFRDFKSSRTSLQREMP